MTGTLVIQVRRFKLFPRLRDSRVNRFPIRFTVTKGRKRIKNLWGIDDEPAEVVRKIFRLCIEGCGLEKIVRILIEESIPTPTAYAMSQGRDNGHKNANLHRWESETIAHILEKTEYCGHTANFRTHVKSYKNKKRVDIPKDDWLISENTHEAIVTQQEFDLVQ